MIAMVILIDRIMAMKRTISAGEARTRLGELLEAVYYRGDEVVIERAGKPMAVVIPAARYEAMERSRKESFDRMWEFIERTHEKNRDVPPEEIERDIEEAIAEVRRQKREEEANKPGAA
jgi:prevent-host-death family protein